MNVSSLNLLSLGVAVLVWPAFLSSDVLGQDAGTAVARDRTLRYSTEVLEKYDTDRNGYLDNAERLKMRLPFKSDLDLNGDGRFDLNEIYYHYTGGRALAGVEIGVQSTGSTLTVGLELYRLGSIEEAPKSDEQWVELLAQQTSQFSMETDLIIGVESTFQLGIKKPQVVAQASNVRGTGRQQSVRLEEIGVMAKLRPYANKEQTYLALDLQYSGMAQPAEESDLGVASTEILKVSQTVATLPDGAALVRMKYDGVDWIIKVSTE